MSRRRPYLLGQDTILSILPSPSPLPSLYLVPFSPSILAGGMTIHRLKAKTLVLPGAEPWAHFHVLIDEVDGWISGSRSSRGLVPLNARKVSKDLPCSPLPTSIPELHAPLPAAVTCSQRVHPDIPLAGSRYVVFGQNRVLQHDGMASLTGKP